VSEAKRKQKRSAKPKRLRVLVLVHETLVPPTTIEGLSDKEIAPFKTEYDVIATLENMGHDVRPLGVASDLGMIRAAIEEFRPHVTFNLLEEFHGVAVYDQHVVSYLELMKSRYTGCNPRGLMLAHDKALSKQILAYHRIRVPEFAAFPMGRRVRRPRRLGFPLLVKSLTEEGSVGIAQASLVHDDDQLRERTQFVHRQLRTDAIAEQFIAGRELYVGVLGNQRLETLPVWELKIRNKAGDEPLIATSKVKWDVEYQKKRGIVYGPAKEVPEKLLPLIERICKRTYRHLNLSGYARIDLRLTDDGTVYVLEANPNPELSYGGEFGDAAEAAGYSYEKLLQKIIGLGLRYRAEWQVD
jgi:D-alanine-D-alanine ligase